MSIGSKIVLVICIIITIVSCRKQETSWDIDGAVPIARSHLNLANFFSDSIFNPDNNGLLHIAFTRELLNYTMDSIAKLPDTTVKVSFISFLPSTALSPNTLVFSNNSSTDKEITFDVANGVELNKAIVRNGGLSIQFKNTYTQPLRFVYVINSATLWGNPLKIDEVIPAGSTSTPKIITKYYPLDGYTISLTGLNNNKVNTLVQTYTISTDASGVADNLTIGQGFEALMSFKKVVPEYVQGYFGNQKLTQQPDSQAINLFSNFKPSNLVLTQAAINFRIVNEFGAELTSSIKQLKSIKQNPYGYITLNSGSLLSPINVNRAGKTNNSSNPVFPFVKQININTNNSNLNPFLENLPDLLGYSVEAELNPLGNISAGNDFAYYGRGLKVFADVDIPMQISANSFYLQSFSKADLSNLSELNNVNYGEVILQAQNNYPFEAKLQGYILNEQNTVIDSLFNSSNNTIPAALTDINNNVLNYTNSKLTVDLNEAKLANLKLCKQIKFVIRLILPNQPTSIKLMDSSYLDLILSANVNYKVRIK